MTDDERVTRLENQIRHFNAIVSGVGLQGGFGHLPDARGTLEERVARIQQAHNNFAVRGGDLATVEGNLRSGLAISFKCQQAAPSGDVSIPPSPPLPPTCPCGLQVTFHDVIFDCPCVIYGSGSAAITDVGLFNEVPISLVADTPTAGCSSCLYDWSSGDVELHAKVYSNTDCTSLINEANFGFAGNIQLWQTLDGTWHLTLTFFTDNPMVFYGTSTNVHGPYSNLLTCSHDTIPTPVLDCTSINRSTASHGGTATITSTPC